MRKKSPAFEDAVELLEFFVGMVRFDLIPRNDRSSLNKTIEKFYEEKYVDMEDAIEIRNEIYRYIEEELDMFLIDYEGNSKINKLILDSKKGVFDEDMLRTSGLRSMEKLYDYLTGLSADDGEDIIDEVLDYLDDIWAEVKKWINKQRY